MNGRNKTTPRVLNKILTIAILIAILALNNEEILVTKISKGTIKMEKTITVEILKKMEKWASFLLSLLQENKVKSGSKLVPILAPNINGIAWCKDINPDSARI